MICYLGEFSDTVILWWLKAYCQRSRERFPKALLLREHKKETNKQTIKMINFSGASPYRCSVQLLALILFITFLKEAESKFNKSPLLVKIFLFFWVHKTWMSKNKWLKIMFKILSEQSNLCSAKWPLHGHECSHLHRRH